MICYNFALIERSVTCFAAAWPSSWLALLISVVMTGMGDSETCRDEEEDLDVAARRDERERWEGRREASAQKRMAAAGREGGP